MTEPTNLDWAEIIKNAPLSWQRVKFGDVFVERKEKDYVDLPLLSVTRTGLVYQHETERRDTSRSNKSSYLRVLPGDIAYNTMRMWQGVSVYCDKEGIVSPAYTVMRPKESLEGRFIAVLLKFQPLVRRFRAQSQGLVSDTWNLKFKHLAQIPTVIPPLPEQKKIAAILASVDEAIEATEAVIEQTRRVKKGLLQELLTRGIGHTSFKKTAIGEIPEAWDVKRLRELVVEKGLQTGPFGSQLHASEYIEDGVPVVMPKDIEGTRISCDDIARIPLSKANELRKHHLEDGDIIFGRRGDIGRCALVEKGPLMLCGTGCLRARPDDRLFSAFLIEYLQTWTAQYFLETNAVGQTMLNLNTKILGSLPIAVPPKKEQIEIAGILRAVTQQIAEHKIPLEQMKKLKKGLLQDLLTGKVRVNVDDVAEEVRETAEAMAE